MVNMEVFVNIYHPIYMWDIILYGVAHDDILYNLCDKAQGCSPWYAKLTVIEENVTGIFCGNDMKWKMHFMNLYLSIY